MALPFLLRYAPFRERVADAVPALAGRKPRGAQGTVIVVHVIFLVMLVDVPTFRRLPRGAQGPVKYTARPNAHGIEVEKARDAPGHKPSRRGHSSQFFLRHARHRFRAANGKCVISPSLANA